MKAFCRLRETPLTGPRATRHGELHACPRDRGGEEEACDHHHTRVRSGEAQEEAVEHGFARKSGQKNSGRLSLSLLRSLMSLITA